MCREKDLKNIAFTNELLVCSISEPISWAKKRKADFIELTQHLAECEVAIDNQLMSVSNDYLGVFQILVCRLHRQHFRHHMCDPEMPITECIATASFKISILYGIQK